MKYYLFANIPNQHAAYSVAVLATGPEDARRYIKTSWRGGKLLSVIERGEVKADCGGVTDAAAAVIHEGMKGITW